MENLTKKSTLNIISFLSRVSYLSIMASSPGLFVKPTKL